jgi:hypothetical protein
MNFQPEGTPHLASSNTRYSHKTYLPDKPLCHVLTGTEEQASMVLQDVYDKPKI